MQTAAVVEAVKRYVVNTITGKPLFVTVEVTEDCNADCDYCGYRRTNHDGSRVTESLGAYLNIITALNPVVVSFTGGEPLLRNDLEGLVEEAKFQAKVPLVMVTTNGSLLTPKRYFSLSEAGLDRLNISLDFLGSMHDDERGIPGLYQRIVDFLEHVKGEKGAKVALSTIYMKENLAEIQKIISLAGSYFAQVNLIPYNPIKNGNCMHVASGTDGTFGRLKMANGDVVANPQVTIANTKRYLETGAIGKCDAGHSFLWVLPDGRLRACIEHPESEGRTLQEVRTYKNRNDCNKCYSNCRAIPETATNPLNAIRIALEMNGKF